MPIDADIIQTVIAGIFGLLAGVFSSYIAKRKDITEQYSGLTDAMKKLMDEKETLWKERLSDLQKDYEQSKNDCAKRIDELEARLTKYEKTSGFSASP